MREQPKEPSFADVLREMSPEEARAYIAAAQARATAARDMADATFRAIEHEDEAGE